MQPVNPPIDGPAPYRGGMLHPVGALYAVEAMGSVGGTLMSIGIFFYMRDRFGWQMPQNFLLAAAQGVVYVPGALLAGRVAARFGQRRTLCGVYLLLALLTLGACALAASKNAWAGAGVAAALLGYTFTIGINWPLLESLVAAGGPPSGMARRVSVYNVVWPAAGAVAIAIEGTIIQNWIAGLFLVPAALHAGSLLIVLLMRPAPASPIPAPPTHTRGAPALLRKRRLALWLSRTALPATYTVVYGLMPMMPSLPVMRHLPTTIQTVVGSVWLMTRWLAFAILSLGAWWHTRPRALLWAAVVMLIAFFGMTLRPTQGASPTTDLVSMIVWQAMLGLALGMIYAGSLYFGMVLSEGSTAHGGYHEALIGLGWVLGPAAGAVAQRVRPDDVLAGVGAVGAVIGASVLAVLVIAIVMGREKASGAPA